MLILSFEIGFSLFSMAQTLFQYFIRNFKKNIIQLTIVWVMGRSHAPIYTIRHSFFNHLPHVGVLIFLSSCPFMLSVVEKKNKFYLFFIRFTCILMTKIVSHPVLLHQTMFRRLSHDSTVAWTVGHVMMIIWTT